MAQLIAWTHAKSPEQHEAGFEALEQWVHSDSYDRSYEAGREAARSECLCYSDPLD